MANRGNFLLLTSNGSPAPPIPNVKRSDFKDVLFGGATSAYQIEGAWNVGGKGKSNWDIFTQSNPSRISDGSNGCTAINHYNLFKDDVVFMKKLGLKSYRFSIAWSRILPGGKIYAGVSKEGIKFYNDLIDELIAAGIEPCATLFHWDTPQCLETEYGGFLDPQIVDDFGEFASVCFWSFGDRVKLWITLNEPWSYAVQGYANGSFPPGRSGSDNPRIFGRRSRELVRLPVHRGNAGLAVHRSNAEPPPPSTGGNAGTEPYIVGHNLILAHARAVDIYRKKYQATQGGKIGMTNVSAWFAPWDENQENIDAASRGNDFMIGWFVAPMVTGDYPESMRENVRDRLPVFDDEKDKVKGSYDFLGINYYTTRYAKNAPNEDPNEPDTYFTDQEVAPCTIGPDGTAIGKPAYPNSWLYIVPWGIYELLTHLKETYGNPEIYITENGVLEENKKTQNVTLSLSDVVREKYFNDHLYYIKRAIDYRVRVKGYYMWSVFDNFEWDSGYSVRFGISYINYEDGVFTRLPKQSALWWMDFLNKKDPPPSEERERGPVKRIRSN